MKPALEALACKLVQLRAVSSVLVISARPNVTPLNSRPTASIWPPFNPANARSPEPPSVSNSTSTGVDDSSNSVNGLSASVTVLLLFSSAILPLNRKNPYKSIVRVPLACISSPWSASKSTAIDSAAATGTWYEVFAKSSNDPSSTEERLIAIERSLLARVMPSTPTRAALSAPALTELHFRFLLS